MNDQPPTTEMPIVPAKRDEEVDALPADLGNPRRTADVKIVVVSILCGSLVALDLGLLAWYFQSFG